MSNEDNWLTEPVGPEAGVATSPAPGNLSLPLARTVTDAVVEVLTSAGFWSGLALCILAGRASLGG